MGLISSLVYWNNKEQLSKAVKDYPDKVEIDADFMLGKWSGPPYSGLVSRLPYGVTAVVNYHNTTFGFKKNTDATFSVE